MTYNCLTCNYSTQRISNFNAHLTTNKHNNSQDIYIPGFNCDCCKYSTNKKFDFNRHLLSTRHMHNKNDHDDIEENVGDMFCESCDYSTNKKFDFSRHLISKKHSSKNNSPTSSEIITPSVSVISLTSVDYSSEEDIDYDKRISVKNSITGEIRYNSNAPKQKNLTKWLESHKDWDVHDYTKRSDRNNQVVNLLRKVIVLMDTGI